MAKHNERYAAGEDVSGEDPHMDLAHRLTSRTHGSKVQPDGPKTGTKSAGFKPKGSRAPGKPEGESPRR